MRTLGKSTASALWMRTDRLSKMHADTWEWKDVESEIGRDFVFFLRERDLIERVTDDSGLCRLKPGVVEYARENWGLEFDVEQSPVPVQQQFDVDAQNRTRSTRMLTDGGSSKRRDRARKPDRTQLTLFDFFDAKQ